ncbi:hypothetical protein [Larkinella terrae]|uniref:Uncharacterized protein n=1 Tax=Larkinella terrae TaxID=2025311 RepID=A0A7K0EJ28_9BACT|nr:hypothetical protein [Larkinella terrae]MRS61817.1 hypothetical protein [Larkinella terrae]
MSKSAQLQKVLQEKGWKAKVWWEPYKNELWGSAGGYNVEIENYDAVQLIHFHGFWLGHDFDSAMIEVNKYPVFDPVN